MAEREPTEKELEAMRQLHQWEFGRKAVIMPAELERCYDEEWVDTVQSKDPNKQYRLTDEGRKLLGPKKYRLSYYDDSNNQQPVRYEVVTAVTSTELTEKALGLMLDAETLVSTDLQESEED